MFRFLPGIPKIRTAACLATLMTTTTHSRIQTLASTANTAAPEARLSPEQKALEAKVATLQQAVKTEKTQAEPTQLSQFTIEAQLLQTKVHNLLCQSKMDLPRNCSASLFYSHTLFELAKTEIEASKDLPPTLNISQQDKNGMLFNRLNRLSHEHWKLAERCEQENTFQIEYRLKPHGP